MSCKEEELEGLVQFIFELGQLKRIPRSGWLKLGINDPETVAEHCFRTGAIGFLLAEMEGYDPYKVAGYCLFHDMAETRTGDLDWLAQRYLEKGDYLSSEVLEDQLERLPEKLRESMKRLFGQTKEKGKLERIARDADLLDLAFQALEYEASGNDSAREWFENTVPLLKTDSGRRIGSLLKERSRSKSLQKLLAWWKGLKIKGDRDN